MRTHITAPPETCAGVGNDRFVCFEETSNSEAFKGTTLDLCNYADSPGELQSRSSRTGPGRQEMWTALPSLSLIHRASLKKSLVLIMPQLTVGTTLTSLWTATSTAVHRNYKRGIMKSLCSEAELANCRQPQTVIVVLLCWVPAEHSSPTLRSLWSKTHTEDNAEMQCVHASVAGWWHTQIKLLLLQLD